MHRDLLAGIDLVRQFLPSSMVLQVTETYALFMSRGIFTASLLGELIDLDLIVIFDHTNERLKLEVKESNR